MEGPRSFVRRLGHDGGLLPRVFCRVPNVRIALVQARRAQSSCEVCWRGGVAALALAHPAGSDGFDDERPAADDAHWPQEELHMLGVHGTALLIHCAFRLCKALARSLVKL